MYFASLQPLSSLWPAGLPGCPPACVQRPPGGYNITVFHTMHDEVNLYRTHVWCCNRCGNTVKRAMNRPPQEADCRAYSKAAAAAAAAAGAPGAYCADPRCWYHSHVRECGGRYDKVSSLTPCVSPSGCAGTHAKAAAVFCFSTFFYVVNTTASSACATKRHLKAAQ